ncbi:MAG: MoxR family ATPase [Planctomycetaceae bacterium]
MSTEASSTLLLQRLRTALNGVLRGKADVVENVLVCLLARGHLLLEDRPGLGKTTLAKALAAAVGGRFTRVQCTPDLLPSDITGFNIFNQKTHEFEFRPGPVFADVLLADEINRATPRAQSALLEAMAERQVTVDAERYPLSSEFFVIATQNPIDQHGTYPLPEAQLDRFAMKLSVGYPDPADEVQMLNDAVVGGDNSPSVPPLLGDGQLRSLQQQVAHLRVDPSLQQYLVQLGSATRQHPQVTLGASPRGLLQWQRAAQAKALLSGRNYVTPDDIQQIAIPVLSVRLGIEQENPAPVIEQILSSVSIPAYKL